jgi:hypothetical protein
MFNPIIRGWINYYGGYYKSALYRTFWHLDRVLSRWASRKYKRLRGRQRRHTGPLRMRWLDDRSRMSREAHVRICESAGGRFPCATRPFKF